jgi:2-aminoethylphosphonate-pyruvate transaminase
VNHRQYQDDGEETKMLSEHKLAAQAPFPAPALGEPYLLTPGPLTTSYAVKQAMLRDWGSWDGDFRAMTAEMRQRLLAMLGDAND